MTARLHFLLTLFLTLVANLAVAQDNVTRGDALRRREFQTYSRTQDAPTLYVSASGNDNNACTDSGALACGTLQGAWNKLPRFLRHNVTISVDTIDYADGGVTTALTGKWVDQPSVLADGGTGVGLVTVNIVGPSKKQWTPTTGSVTGTITAVSSTNGINTWTDGAQAWTTDDLDGRYLRFTSGALSGRVFGIWANTATTVNVIPTATPGLGDAYEIVTNGAVLPAINVGELGVISVTISDIDFVSTGAPCNAVTNMATPGTALRLHGVRCVGTGGTSGSLISYLGVTSTGVNTSGPPMFLASGTAQALSVSRGWTFTATDGSFYARSGSANSVLRLGCASSGRATSVPGCGSWVSGVAKTTNTATVAVVLVNWPEQALSTGGTNAWLIAACPAGSTGTGIALNGSSQHLFHRLHATGCATGVTSGTYSTNVGTFTTALGTTTGNGTLACTNVTTCLALTRGSRFSFATYSASGVTNDYSVDGVTYTDAQLTSFSPARIIGADHSTLSKP